jgi:hypothetical protein
MKLFVRHGLVLARSAGAVGLVLMMASDGYAQLRRVVADIQPVVSTEPCRRTVSAGRADGASPEGTASSPTVRATRR